MKRLERRLAKLEEQNRQLIQAAQHNHQPAGINVSDLIGTLAGNQVQQIEATGGFIKLIHEIAVDRMGAAMGKRSAGQRGGKARAARAIRDERGRMRGSRERSGCVLCDDPMTANFSTRQWEEHQAHKGGAGYERRDDRNERSFEADFGPVAESHTHPDGTVHPGPLVLISNKLIFPDGTQVVVGVETRALWQGADGAAFDANPETKWKIAASVRNGIILDGGLVR